MKTLKYLVVALAGIFIFAGCAKELSFETGSLSGLATGSLEKSLAGDCLDIGVQGQYVKDSTLGDSSYVTVQVNFTSPGRYKLYTDSENGFSFSDSGFMINTGLQTVTLKASGKPLVTQETNFTVYLDSSYCMFTVNVTDTPVVQRDAVFTLGSCGNTSVQGTYEEGTPLDASNLVSMEVNVTTPGSYDLVFGPVNGMSFSSRGTFTSTGLKTVNLRGSGTPIAAETDSISISINGTTCTFGVVVQAGSGTGGGGGGGTVGSNNWTFAQGTRVFKGNIIGAQLNKDPLGGSAYILTLSGTTLGNDSLLAINIEMPGSTIQSGTYKTDGALFNMFNFSGSSSIIYSAGMGTPGAVITFVLTYDPTTKVVSGTFSGNANNASNNAVPITAGTFTTVVQ